MPYSAADYLDKARQCDSHAAAAESEQLKQQFLSIAHQWRRLAEHVGQAALVIISRRGEAEF
jgi:hypothetical protein